MAIELLEAALETPQPAAAAAASAAAASAAAASTEAPPLLPPLSPKRAQRLARLVRQARAAPLDGAAAALQRRVAQAAAELLGGGACAARLTEGGDALRCGGGGGGGGGGGEGGGGDAPRRAREGAPGARARSLQRRDVRGARLAHRTGEVQPCAARSGALERRRATPTLDKAGARRSCRIRHRPLRGGACLGPRRTGHSSRDDQLRPDDR